MTMIIYMMKMAMIIYERVSERERERKRERGEVSRKDDCQLKLRQRRQTPDQPITCSWPCTGDSDIASVEFTAVVCKVSVSHWAWPSRCRKYPPRV